MQADSGGHHLGAEWKQRVKKTTIYAKRRHSGKGKSSFCCGHSREHNKPFFKLKLLELLSASCSLHRHVHTFYSGGWPQSCYSRPAGANTSVGVTSTLAVQGESIKCCKLFNLTWFKNEPILRLKFSKPTRTWSPHLHLRFLNNQYWHSHLDLVQKLWTENSSRCDSGCSLYISVNASLCICDSTFAY